MTGCAVGSGEAMSTLPRLSGRRLQTEAVIAGNGSSGWPKAGSDKGWTWYSRLGVATSSDDRAKAQSCDGAMDMGPDRKSAYSRPIFALPISEFAIVFSVFAPVRR